jgi:hypothetical protein
MDYRLEAALQKENIKQIQRYNKLIDQAKNGNISSSSKDFFTYIGDVSDYIYIFNQIKRKNYKQARCDYQSLDTNARETFPDRLNELLYNITEE